MGTPDDRAAAMAAELEVLKTRIEALQVAQDNPQGTKSRRKRLPVGAPFDGKKELFPAWKTTIQHILVADQEFIGDHHNQWVFIWSNLTAPVQNTVASFYEKWGPEAGYDPQVFLNYLESTYANPHEERVASQELEVMKQRSDEPFHTYIVRFEAKMAKAGGLRWTDGQKLRALERTLNDSILDVAMAMSIPDDNYIRAVECYREIATKVEARRLRKKHQQRFGEKANDNHGQQGPQVDSEGDTRMTGVGSARTQRPRNKNGTNKVGPQAGGASRAAWVSEGIRAARRAAGACIRCGKKGHFIAECPMRPAVQPSSPAGKARKPVAKVRWMDVPEEQEEESPLEEEEEDEGAKSKN